MTDAGHPELSQTVRVRQSDSLRPSARTEFVPHAHVLPSKFGTPDKKHWMQEISLIDSSAMQVEVKHAKDLSGCCSLKVSYIALGGRFDMCGPAWLMLLDVGWIFLPMLLAMLRAILSKQSNVRNNSFY